MSATLKLTLIESDVNIEKNTSAVKATLSITASGNTYNNSACPGYIIIDGVKYNFSCKFAKDKTTTLAIFSKNITHNTDGSKEVAVTGYYSTGTAVGNLSVTKNITLTKISRKHTVSYDANGGVGAPGSQIKEYGTALKLSSTVPSKTGYKFLYWSGYGGNYYPDGYYYADVDTVMKANWSELTAIVKYVSNGHGTFSKDVKISYTALYKIESPDYVEGYTFRGWNTKSNGSGTWYAPGKTYKNSNSIPVNITLYAIWAAKTYSVNYHSNGGTWIYNPNNDNTYRLATYDSNYRTAPSNCISRSEYDFKGWSKTPTGQVDYEANSTFIWNIAKNTSLYAIWQSIYIPINFYKIKDVSQGEENSIDFSKSSNYVLYKEETNKPLRFNSYTLPNISVPNLYQYTFSGYWTVEKPSTKIYTEYGMSFPAAIIPYDYSPQFINNYSIEDNFYKPGYIFNSVDNTLDLYPVYRDNTASSIKNEYNTYNYTSSLVSQNTYFLYLSKQINEIKNSLYSEYVLIGAVFKSPNSKVTLQYDNLNVTLMSENDDQIRLEPIFIRELLKDNQLYYYIVCKNLDVLIDPENIQYRLNISGLKDIFGKNLSDIHINIIPPKLIRDINSEGDVVSMFSAANDYSSAEKIRHTENEFWIDGISLLNNLLINSSKDEEGSFYNTVVDFLGEDCLYDIKSESDPEDLRVLEYPDLVKILTELITKVKVIESLIPSMPDLDQYNFYLVKR